jgi:hypothetical protein
MKNVIDPSSNLVPSCVSKLSKWYAILCLAILSTSSVFAEFVYLTSTPSNCVSIPDCGGLNINSDINNLGGSVYTENVPGDFTSAIALALGKPNTPGARYFSIAFSNATPDFGVMLSPTLSVTGGTYKVYHVFSSAAGNVSTNIVVGFTNYNGCTLSFTNSDKFQSSYGVSSNGLNVWQFLGYVTNNVDMATPSINMYFVDGEVSSGAQRRLLVDTFLFVDDPCTEIAQLAISGSYKVGDTNVVVTGVNGSATALKVYQYTNGIWSLVGQRTSGIVVGTNSIAVSGLAKGAQLAATQTIGGQEGCLWGVPTGIIVGTPNPRLRLALSLRETTSTGPAGSTGLTSGFTASANIYFLGVTNRLSSAPGFPGKILYPSNSVWQEVTFQRGPDYANPIDPSIKWNTATGYDPVGTVNDMTSNWYTIDALAFVIDDLTSTGPHDIYIDTIKNGAVTFYTFENSPAFATDVGLRAPSFSGTTGGNLAGSPNSAAVANNVAYEGTKSMRVQWAWNGATTTKWLRLTTSGAGNPQVNVEDPITIRYLYVPDGGTYPAAPPRPTLTADQVGGQTILNWTGGHRLQTAPILSGPYTNTGVILGPYTNSFPEVERYFRLMD